MVLFTQESASKEGLFTLKEYGDRMMKGQRDAGWIDAVLEEAEDYRAIVGFSLSDDYASVEFVRLDWKLL